MSRRLTNIELDQIDEIVERYQEWVAEGQDAYAKTGMLKDCRLQFAKMAAGSGSSLVSQLQRPRSSQSFWS